LYPDLTDGRRRAGAKQKEEEEQDVTMDGSDDSSFDSSAEEVRNVAYDTSPRKRRAHPRAPSPNPSSTTDSPYSTAERLLERTRERLYGRPTDNSDSDINWQDFFEKNVKELAIGALLLFTILMFFFSGSSDFAVDKPPDAMDLFNQGLKKLMIRYNGQDRQSWLTVKTAGKLVFNSSVVAEPAVVLLAGEPSTTSCFAQELAAVALASYGLDDVAVSATVINGASFRSSDGSGAKKVLDNRLGGILSQFNVATLLAIDGLPGDSPIMLHSYCDHENAPFKDAFIILSVNMDTDSEVGWKGCDAAVHAALAHRWKAGNALNDDKIGALLARMANFVVCLRSQSDISC